MIDNINVLDKEAELKLSSSLYSENSIDRTIERFEKNFSVTKKEDGEEVSIGITTELDVDMEEVALEFFNFLLSFERDKKSSTTL